MNNSEFNKIKSIETTKLNKYCDTEFQILVCSSRFASRSFMLLINTLKGRHKEVLWAASGDKL